MQRAARPSRSGRRHEAGRRTNAERLRVPKRHGPIGIPEDAPAAPLIVVRAHRPHGDVVLSGDDTKNGRRYLERAQRWFETQPEQLDLGLADVDEIRCEEIRRFTTASEAWATEGLTPLRSFRIRYVAPITTKRGRVTTPPAIAGKRYSSGVGVERRAVSSFVLRAATEGNETSRGYALTHVEPTYVAEVELRPIDEAALANVRAAVSRLSPTVESTFDVLLAHALELAPDHDGNYTLEIDAVLDAQGVQPKRGRDGYKAGHRPDDRVRTVNDARALDQTFVASTPLRHRGRRARDWQRVISIQAWRLLDVIGDVGEIDLTAIDPEQVVALRYTFGPWFGPFKSAHEQAKLTVPRRLLELPAVSPAQTIGRYFFQRAGEADGQGRIFRVVRGLLADLGWKYRPGSPKEVRDRLEGALQKLESERIVASWDYLDDTGDLGRKGWLDRWLGFRLWVRLG